MRNQSKYILHRLSEIQPGITLWDSDVSNAFYVPIYSLLFFGRRQGRPVNKWMLWPAIRYGRGEKLVFVAMAGPRGSSSLAKRGHGDRRPARNNACAPESGYIVSSYREREIYGETLRGTTTLTLIITLSSYRLIPKSFFKRPQFGPSALVSTPPMPPAQHTGKHRVFPTHRSNTR